MNCLSTGEGKEKGTEMKYSESVEMYLKEIYRLSIKGPEIRATDVAIALGVSKSSVNRAVKKLSREGLLNHATYGHIEITTKGTQKARAICEKQEIIVEYLVTALDVGPQLAMAEACKMEHVVGTVVIDKMKEAVNQGRNADEVSEIC